MLRYLFIFLLLIHAMIHFMGFAKAFKLADTSQLTQSISKPLGGLWLLGGLLFISASIAFLLKKEWWWIIVIGAILFSQILIFIYWEDAKYGTIANIIILVVGILAYGDWQFNKMTTNELHLFQLDNPKLERKVLSREMLSSLPPIVQKWLQRSNCIGKNIIQSVRLKQRGTMRIKQSGSWMKVEADQYFRVNKPGFLWIAKVGKGSWMQFLGRDKYEAGKGNMLIKLFSLFTVADAEGRKTDEASALRYLAEIVWFPSAAVSDYISWEEIDARTAKATINYADISVSGIFNFNEVGDFVSFETKRYYGQGENATLEDWYITNEENDYKAFEGIRIPTKPSVTWKLATGDFTWYKLEILEVAYN